MVPPPPVNGMPALPAQPLGSPAAAAPGQVGAVTPPLPSEQQQKKKKGFFGRLFGGGKGDQDDKQHLVARRTEPIVIPELNVVEGYGLQRIART